MNSTIPRGSCNHELIDYHGKHALRIDSPTHCPSGFPGETPVAVQGFDRLGLGDVAIVRCDAAPG